MPARASGQQFLDGKADVARDLAQQGRRNVRIDMERECRPPAIGMTVLPVGSPCDRPRRNRGIRAEPRPHEASGRESSPRSSHAKRLHADELGPNRRLAVLEKHLDNLPQVGFELGRIRALAGGSPSTNELTPRRHLRPSRKSQAYPAARLLSLVRSWLSVLRPAAVRVCPFASSSSPTGGPGGLSGGANSRARVLRAQRKSVVHPSGPDHSPASLGRRFVLLSCQGTTSD